MSREANFELEGEVIDKYPGGKFKVKINQGKVEHEINATLSGKIRMNYIKLVVGDKVKVSVSPYDMDNGYITRRL